MYPFIHKGSPECPYPSFLEFIWSKSFSRFGPCDGLGDGPNVETNCNCIVPNTIQIPPSMTGFSVWLRFLKLRRPCPEHGFRREARFFFFDEMLLDRFEGGVRSLQARAGWVVRDPHTEVLKGLFIRMNYQLPICLFPPEQLLV